MKIKKILFFTLLAGLVFLPMIAFAQTKPNIGLGDDGLVKDAVKEAGYNSNTTETTFASTLGAVVKILMNFSGVIFMSLMVYAGFLWMTARGEEAKVDKAQSIIKASIIGLVIVVSAYSITFFIVPRLLTETAPKEAALE
ncbi:MAG: hypothetical protein A2469_03325 [Candidatus Magasanikbacteria bacterium RIFOXYC2_FULL_40_16]|uniref:DUF4134 domain-containing protein n=3 Tax=Candidatus Magasanikiibacteriota TaxID=1752731 RepID=A0A1F6NGD7_9BACT|nr:MAG: hypothetical protein A2373_04205 [Candidatus Magasanikbacteria bacterium RIFOXYB1_FULL_40_15]OGH87262.1 MAG: hypothetical protein A2206_03010 [Candidatus Magasanikbacteria bacterium RIFOXYA1_FULL_40_8]OGH89841.1 MAG: hypothetical protein A2469_03325 [Candidatus Magasanikbacteria bacterium RIFOXYC2_FULL_40_16]